MKTPGLNEWFGAAVKRKEDPALLRGEARFIDDINAEITNICRCGTFQQVREAIHAAANA